jgi:hypothetical protein
MHLQTCPRNENSHIYAPAHVDLCFSVAPIAMLWQVHLLESAAAPVIMGKELNGKELNSTNAYAHNIAILLQEY